MKKKSKKISNRKRWQELSKLMRECHPSCEVCGHKDNLQVHHACCSKYYHKSVLRFDPSNLLVVCPTCHFAAHKSPIQIMEWFFNNRRNDYEKCLAIIGILIK